LRKITKTKGAFTSEDALKKLIFVAIRNITEDCSNPLWLGTAFICNSTFILKPELMFLKEIDFY